MGEPLDLGSQYRDLHGTASIDGFNSPPQFALAREAGLEFDGFPVAVQIFSIAPDGVRFRVAYVPGVSDFEACRTKLLDLQEQSEDRSVSLPAETGSVSLFDWAKCVKRVSIGVRQNQLTDGIQLELDHHHEDDADA